MRLLLFFVAIPFTTFCQNANDVFSKFNLEFNKILPNKTSFFSIDSVFKTSYDSIYRKEFSYKGVSMPLCIYSSPIKKISIITDSNNSLREINLKIPFDSNFYTRVKEDLGQPKAIFNLGSDEEVIDESKSTFYIWILDLYKFSIHFERYDVDFGQKRNDDIIITYSK